MNPRIVKTGIIVFFMLIWAVAAGSDQNQTESAGIVKTLKGKAYIYRDEIKIKVEQEMPILEKDILVTKKDTQAGIVFSDGTVITIGPESVFEMTAFVFKPDEALYDFSFYMEKGSAIYNSGKIGRISPQSVKLTTPKATVGIRGTRFVVDL